MTRIAITLDEHAHAELALRAQANREPVARTAARYVRDGLLSATPRVEAPGGEPAASGGQRSAGAAWLEPAPAVRDRWRRETWAAVCALHERYPRALEKLIADWWRDRALTEQLSALAHWRAQLDGPTSTDPRAELLFHDRLQLLDRQLQSVDPMAPRFTAGPPPAEWVA